MKLKGTVASYSVNQKNISVKIGLRLSSPKIVTGLQEFKGKNKTIRIDTLQVGGIIDSVNISKNTSFLIHTRKYESVSRKLFILTDEATPPVDIVISDDLEDKLLLFLDETAGRLKENKEDLLYRLSSFTKKEKGIRTEVPGKRSVFDMSPAQQKVVLNKLNALIRNTVIEDASNV